MGSSWYVLKERWYGKRVKVCLVPRGKKGGGFELVWFWFRSRVPSAKIPPADRVKVKSRRWDEGVLFGATGEIMMLIPQLTKDSYTSASLFSAFDTHVISKRDDVDFMTKLGNISCDDTSSFLGPFVQGIQFHFVSETPDPGMAAR